MMTNRAMRDRIEQRHGIGVREEVARWNDQDRDGLGDFGVELSTEEEVRQAAHLDHLRSTRAREEVEEVTQAPQAVQGSSSQRDEQEEGSSHLQLEA